jgi:hypothetical protein
MEQTNKQQRVRAKKEYYRKQWQNRQRREYFASKDTHLIVAQLNSEENLNRTVALQTAPVLSIPERAVLARLANIREKDTSITLVQRAGAVQAIADLCRRVEFLKMTVDRKKLQTVQSPTIV